jgi:hypothetical protein
MPISKSSQTPKARFTVIPAVYLILKKGENYTDFGF